MTTCSRKKKETNDSQTLEKLLLKQPRNSSGQNLY